MEKLIKRPLKTALHQAILDNRLHQVRLLVEVHGVKVDTKDVFGRTPLMLTCLLNDAEEGNRMMKILLRAGAYASVTDNMARTALHYACMKGREKAVVRFLKEGVSDVNGPDSDGNTPLGYASMAGYKNIVNILIDMIIKFGINIDDRNTMGYTPLLLACRHAHYDCAFLLINSGNAQPQLRDNEFFLNARDWIIRSGNLISSQVLKRSKLKNIKRLKFERETTIYGDFHKIKECNHVKMHRNLILTDSSLSMKLPTIFHTQKIPDLAEDITDCRLKLLTEIDSCSDDVTSTLPLITSSYLLPRRRSRSNLEPDLSTLFSLYSDQYRERCQHKYARDLKDSRRIKIKTPSSLSCDIA